ncbi:hypothetical protein HDU96_004624, partial [Phlyctochytrium bullatum]
GAEAGRILNSGGAAHVMSTGRIDGRKRWGLLNRPFAAGMISWWDSWLRVVCNEIVIFGCMYIRVRVKLGEKSISAGAKSISAGAGLRFGQEGCHGKTGWKLMNDTRVKGIFDKVDIPRYYHSIRIAIVEKDLEATLVCWTSIGTRETDKSTFDSTGSKLRVIAVL